MNLFFTQGGSRLKCDTAGNWYTDSNFNNAIWDRYKALCDKLIVVLRREQKIYDVSYAKSHFAPVDEQKMELIPVPDLYSPMSNYFNPRLRIKTKHAIKVAIEESDKAIIRSGGNFYTTFAGKCCRALGEPYLSEVTGFIYEGLMQHGTFGKLKALPSEKATKKLVQNATYASYVTTKALQKRYPCQGKMESCSDVEILNLDSKAVSNRKKIDLKKGVILGTAGALDVAIKGQRFAVEAISLLKNRGLSNISYQLVGLGSGSNIKKIATEHEILPQIKFVGGLPHGKIFEWADSIDIYIQPSLQEGLSRSIIEAMSRGCPVIATDVGGNPELIDHEWLVPAGDAEALAAKIQMMIEHPEKAARQSSINFEKAKAFDKKILDSRRDSFYQDFINQV